MSPLGLSKASLLLAGGEAPYEGASTSADLLWHLKNYETASYGTAENVTFNVGGTNRNSRITTYSGNQTWGAGSASAASGRLTCIRTEGNLTISSGFTYQPSTDCYGLYIFVDGNLTVGGTINTSSLGESRTSAAGTLTVNSSANSVGGTTTIAMNGSAGSHTNGSSTASALTAGGGGQGGYGSFGRGDGNIGHTFAGGSGGGGGGGIAYPEHYSGGGGSGSTATSYSRNGGDGGASGHTQWGYYTSDAGGTGGNGNPAGSGGTNNSYNPSSSRAGFAGYGSTVSSSLVIFATGNITINSGGQLKTAGVAGRTGDSGTLDSGGGGGTGGGILVAVCGGTFTNNGTINRAGGSTGSGRGSGSSAGSGGLLTGGGYA